MRDMARLQWVDRDGEMFALRKQSYLVGKHASCIIRPKRAHCAPRHGRIAFVDGRYVVEALSSEHPVLVNGAAIESHVLEHRDEITCGEFVMSFFADE